MTQIDPNVTTVYSMASRMVGRVLDVVDVTYTDPVQRAKVKKLIQPAMYDFRNEVSKLIQDVSRGLVILPEDAPIPDATEYVAAQGPSEGELIRQRMRDAQAERVENLGADTFTPPQANDGFDDNGMQVGVERSTGPLTDAQLEKFRQQ